MILRETNENIAVFLYFRDGVDGDVMDLFDLRGEKFTLCTEYCVVDRPYYSGH